MSGTSAFWDFSLRVYRRPEVPALCLQLQDQHAIDVNLLFLLCFFAESRRQVSAVEVHRIDAHIQAWRVRVVQPLRAIRRDLKGGIAPIDADAAEALRTAIKRDELQAERLQQECLEREFPPASIGRPAAPRDAARANIAVYGEMLGGLPSEPVNALLAALAAEFNWN